MSKRDSDDSDTAHAPTEPALVTQLAESRDTPAPRARRNSQLDLQPGERLGNRYVIRGFLGSGGMGAVYRVFDETLGEEVALKAVRSSIATTSGLRDEVKIAQKVTHDNVCRTYDLEDVDGRHFVKMEYVPGETLADRIERGPLPIASVIHIARGVAAGLAAAHARGIVHRDLKPGNVMLDRDRPVLMDFGLAQYAARSDVDRAGTPGYMSPEQLAGMAVDQRSDLFALGCLLYEMLSGQRVYGTGSMTEIETRQVEIVVPDIRSKRADVPAWLARATMQLLARERERRPGGLALLHRGPRSKLPILVIALGVVALGIGIAWVATRSSVVDWVPNTTVIRKPSRKTEFLSRTSIAPDSASFIYLVEDGNATKLYRTPLRPEIGPPVEVFPTVMAGHEIRELRDGSGYVFSANVQETIYERDKAGMRQIVRGQGGRPEDCGDSVIAIREVPSGDVYLRWELFAIAKRDNSTRVLVAGEVGESLDYARCDRDGTRVVYSSQTYQNNPKLFVLDLAPGSTPQLLGEGSTPTFANHGAIVYSADGRLMELELDNRESHQLTGDEDYVAPEISPDGTTLLFQREEYASTVYVGGPSQPPTGYQIPMDFERIEKALLTPDRSTLVIERGRSLSIVAIDLANNEQTPLADGSDPFLSHDGRDVLFVAFDRRGTEIRAIPITGGTQRTVIEIPAYRAREGYDAPDGMHLALQIVDDKDKPTGELRAVRVPHGTRDVINEGAGLVMPAPSGPWRARRLRSSVELTDGVVTRKAQCIGVPTWLDDHRFACETAQQVIEILDVADDTRATVTLPWQEREAVLAADGKHWVAIRTESLITQLAITNFADRPWAP